MYPDGHLGYITRDKKHVSRWELEIQDWVPERVVMHPMKGAY